jgi:transcriptional regulator with GAF, ATPase, and Fis domain
MKQYRYYFSAYAIVPVIFAGIAILSSIISVRVVEYYQRIDAGYQWPLFYFIGIMVLLAVICSILVVRILLKPMEGFVQSASQLPVLSDGGQNRPARGRVDALEQYAKLFERVTTLLSTVDIRQLFPGIIGESRAIRTVLSQVVKVAPTESTVLIVGESGSGKELIATSIHQHSHRKDKPIVSLNCAAIPEGLLESELFGHEKGAFTGATSSKKGKFEQAHGGTLFLDEIGDMPLSTQAKVLRVLQEREFTRVGGASSIKVDVRFIAATNKNLQEMTEQGDFREDLYYRLNVVSLYLPPLRERSEDIPLLVNYFLKKNHKDVRMSPAALHTLMGYDWPGNIRELQNVIERASVMSDGIIETAHLPIEIGETAHLRGILPADGNEAGNASESCERMSIDDQMREMEKSMIEEALRRTDGVQVRAAELLGINQRSLWHRIKKYEIDVTAFKSSRFDD